MAASTLQGTLIDDLLAAQSRSYLPVEKFAETHDREPDLAGHYRSLIPLSKPGPGEQYAFEVALDKCTSCKACVTACHSQNGLDEDESWRDVGVLHGGEDAPGWQQTVTTACHHCEDPECLNGCPVKAYEKSEETGIVRHLDDQCIGCSYCIFKCPFDVPKYSKKRGIVRKCDMCHERLAEGEAPACVAACPTEAIRIVKINRLEKSKLGSRGIGFLTGAPSPKITLPTTRYTGRQVPFSATAADRENLNPEHSHWPLVVMLVFTQAAVGLSISSHTGTARLSITILSLTLFTLGLIAATLHLGQPLKAWRFFLGLRTSWLSRELLVFSALGPLLAIPLIFHLPELISSRLGILPQLLTHPAVYALTAFTGLVGVFTSAKIYESTRRELWRAGVTFTRFFLGVGVFYLIGRCVVAASDGRSILAASFCLCLIGIVLLDIFQLRGESLRREAAIIRKPLSTIAIIRLLAAGLACVLIFVSPWLALVPLLITFLAERTIYFMAVRPLKMPGV